MDLKINSVFDEKYLIESKLGAGSLGTVYKAQEIDSDRTLAIKILSSWSGKANNSVHRFKEAQVLCQLKHKNIARVHRFGMETDTSLPFIIMEYVEAESMRSALERLGNFDYTRAMKFALRLADALQYAHSFEIFHADLRPENILIDLSDTEDTILKLIDFGLCKPPGTCQNDALLAAKGELPGSPYYMSPEQVLGKTVDKRTDIYSFALIVFEMLSGQKAFASKDPAELMLLRQDAKVPELLSLNSDSGLPAVLDAFIQRCSAINPADRFEDFEEVLLELSIVASVMPEGAFDKAPKNNFKKSLRNFINNTLKKP